MSYLHVGCGGTVDVRKRTCTKCSKKWGRVGFLTNTEITMGTTREEMLLRLKKKGVGTTTSYSSWADKYPFVSLVARNLPNWPRRYRLLVGLVGFVGIPYLVVTYLGWVVLVWSVGLFLGIPLLAMVLTLVSLKLGGKK